MENMRDMLNANRQGWVRKVSDKDIKDIQASKLKGSELARKYGVSNTTIHRIINRKKLLLYKYNKVKFELTGENTDG